jgi:hypothetical protein
VCRSKNINKVEVVFIGPHNCPKVCGLIFFNGPCLYSKWAKLVLSRPNVGGYHLICIHIVLALHTSNHNYKQNLINPRKRENEKKKCKYLKNEFNIMNDDICWTNL